VDFRCGILCQLLFADTSGYGKSAQQQQSTERQTLIVPVADPTVAAEQVEAQIPGTQWKIVQQLDPGPQELKRNQLLREGSIGLILATLALLVLHLLGRWRDTEQTPDDNCVQGLKDKEQMLSAIVDAAGEGVMLIDEAGKIQLFNPAAEAIFGYTREELIGKGVEHLIPRSLNSIHEKYLSQLVDHKAVWREETTQDLLGRRKNGEKFPLRLSISRFSMGNVTQFVGLMQDISEQLKARERLDYLTSHDALTGLMNRREFERLLESLISINDNEEQQHALCYIDVDQFKVINDTMGHMAGDDLLRQIGVLIKAQVNKAGTVARLGGDEFGVVLGDCSIERAQELAYGLLQTIGNFLFTWIDHLRWASVSVWQPSTPAVRSHPMF
jgi:diguanylate cyclase (GGDEF)-like protein/PAS domain S-box-containing protein